MPSNTRSNIILVGMPGSGKSTVGVLLAKHLVLGFVDTDVLIQVREGRALQAILDSDGYRELRAAEERALLSLDVAGHVVATGGSAVYSRVGMEHLRRCGVVVFLDVPLAVVRTRAGDLSTRGIAAPPGTTFEQLWAERRPLYQRHADITVGVECDTMEEVSARVMFETARRAAQAPS